MAKSRSPIADYLIYLIVRLGVCLIQTLTDRVAFGLESLLGWLAYAIDRRHRQVADDNLRHAFPELGANQRDRLVRGCFQHFASLIVHIARLPRKVHANNWRNFIDWSAGETFGRALASGRPVLIVSAHFGNWEAAGYGLGLLGYRSHAIARPLDNPYLDRFLRRFRERTGQKLLDKKGSFDEMQAIMDSGGILATLADQDAGPRGLFVDFFGRPASTHKAIALLAVRHEVLLVVVGLPMIAKTNHYRLVISDVIDAREYGGRIDAIRLITQRYTSALERMIRRYPEQYFWLHRRWKHQPAAAVRKSAA